MWRKEQEAQSIFISSRCSYRFCRAPCFKLELPTMLWLENQQQDSSKLSPFLYVHVCLSPHLTMSLTLSLTHMHTNIHTMKPSLRFWGYSPIPYYRLSKLHIILQWLTNSMCLRCLLRKSCIKVWYIFHFTCLTSQMLMRQAEQKGCSVFWTLKFQWPGIGTERTTCNK